MCKTLSPDDQITQNKQNYKNVELIYDKAIRFTPCSTRMIGIILSRSTFANNVYVFGPFMSSRTVNPLVLYHGGLVYFSLYPASIQSRGTIGQPAKRHSDGVSLAGR